MAKQPLYPHVPKSRMKKSTITWQEMPSVTSGGKPTFWVAETPQGKRWVVWNRLESKWQVTGEQATPRGEAPVYGRFDSAEAGKRFVEQTNAQPKLTRDDVEVLKWFERDRQHIEVKDKKTGETVAEWWDESVSEMAEDGFFYIPRSLGWRIPAEQHKMDESVLEYLEDIGTLAKA